MSTTNNNTTGIGFAGLLTIVFIVLKLTHVISWSWVWVLAPVWISVGLVILVTCIMGAVIVGIKLSDEKKRKKRMELLAARGRIAGKRNW